MTTSDVNPEFEALLDYLKQYCGYDLTGNKRSSLMRRFQYRMRQLNIEKYSDYLQYLQVHPEECTPLFNAILINYSGFFRDRHAWDYLADKIIPQIIASKQPDERIRIWSAGCASGQEVYTLVMLLVESLGFEQYLQRVQFFATDIDEDALHKARQGNYSSFEVADIDSETLSKYFEQVGQNYVFNSQLRHTVIFGRHDLAFNPPMSKIDLLVCRNVLIYFQREIQASIFVRFHFALANKGFLFLGNSESVTNSRQIFTPVSLKHRIFTKGENLTLDDYFLIQLQTRKKKVVDPLTTQMRIWQTAFDNSPFAQLAVNRSGNLLIANKQAYKLFGLQNSDLGVRVQDLKIGQIIQSWVFMRQLDRDRQPFSLKNVEWTCDRNPIYLDISITPILDQASHLIGANLSFVDVTSYTKFENELESKNSKLARITQELQTTQEQLNTTNRELESAQKELESLYQEIQFRND